jgi:nucleotide-binding universal stress UspA family protein
MHITRILIPVDFSPPSTLAVNYGVALARKLRAAISLLHVVESPGALLYTFPSEAKEVEAQRKEQADKMLPAFVSPEDQDDLDVHFIVRAGEIEEVVGSVLAEEHADAVAMGTHGRGLFGRLFIGSTTQALLRKLGVPVLTVCHVTRPLEFRRILFATDFGNDSDRGFEFALDMAHTTGALLLVAHTRNEPPVLTYETPEIAMMVDEARKWNLKMIHDKFRGLRAQGEGAKVATECLLETGEASENIIRAADENEVDFIILGLRKRGLLDRALGSTAEPVIRGAHVPVLSVPIDTKTQSEQPINKAAEVRS